MSNQFHHLDWLGLSPIVTLHCIAHQFGIRNKFNLRLSIAAVDRSTRLIFSIFSFYQ